MVVGRFLKIEQILDVEILVDLFFIKILLLWFAENIALNQDIKLMTYFKNTL